MSVIYKWGGILIGDLHCHTIKSDGSMAPEAVVELAARLKISCIAITDHDTMSGVADAQNSAESKNVRVVTGIEVSTFDYKNHKKVHILCYLPANPRELLELCRETLFHRNQASLEMIEKISARYPVDVETVRKYSKGSTVIYKQHIAVALMDMGYSLSVYGELYASLFSKKSGGWAIVEGKLPEAREALKIVKESGGAAVLAHPGVYGNFDIIAEFTHMGLDGIEVWHPRQSEQDTQRAFEAAKQFNLLRTGGSDFHGMSSSKVTPLGTKTTESSQLAALLERFDTYSCLNEN